MNSFNYEYPVRQHFGKGCAESAIKEEMKRFLTPGCCKQFSRDEIFEVLKECM